MRRYILTGTPGCGKTLTILALEINGSIVINEAATDVIAYEQALGNSAPWEHPTFIDKIVSLQKQRQIQITDTHSRVQFYDRSPICTYALATYLGFTPSTVLLQEIERIEKNGIYQKKCFFMENLGFCKPTEARKISFEDSLVFEKIHLETYAKFGFECIKIPPIPLLDRANTILELVWP